jgi:eukaryotic-like serine/threonine-protein kinase
VIARKVDNSEVRGALYAMAILQKDHTAIQDLRQWNADQPGEDNIADLVILDLIQQGRLSEAKHLEDGQRQALQRSGFKELSASYPAMIALNESEMGNYDDSRKYADSSATLSRSRTTLPLVAIAFALGGELKNAQATVEELNRRYPSDTGVQDVYIPVAQAALELKRGGSAKAIKFLEPTRRYEFGVDWEFLPMYVRGLAYLAGHQENEAAEQFQRIITHRGVSPVAPVWVLAHLQLGRSFALSGDITRAKAAYQDFLTLWKDADPDIPILKEAKAEYAKLQ